MYAKEKQRQVESIKAKQRTNRIKSSFIQQPNPPSPSMVWNDSRYWNQLRNTDESLDKTEITPFDADLSPVIVILEIGNFKSIQKIFQEIS